MNFVSKAQISPGGVLIERLAALSWADLPATAPERAKACLIDNIACGLFGSQFPWGKITADFVLDEASTGKATVFGRDRGIAPARAAMANGTMIHGFELDDIILGSLSHPGTVVIPAALALAEHRGASVDRLLLGIVAGYEMMARLGAALGPRCNNAGIHTTGVAGAIAAAVASAVVAEASAEVMANAIGIACSSASGIKAFTQGSGGMVKRYHGGHAAECGVTSFQLAERGFTGPLHGIDGRYGLLEVIGGETSDAALLSRGLGADWAIGRVWIKVYSCCGLIHTSVQAAETIRAAQKLEPAAIKAVRIGLGARAVEQNGEIAPGDTMTAQYSIPFCVAACLTGDIRDPRTFDAQGLRDPAVAGMIPRIALYTDPEMEAVFPGKFAARVEIETIDGRRFTETLMDAHGTPGDPLRGSGDHRQIPPDVRVCARRKRDRRNAAGYRRIARRWRSQRIIPGAAPR